MNWSEVAEIIAHRMTECEKNEIARVDIVDDDGMYTTEKAIKLVKDTFGIWTFVIGYDRED